MILLVDIGNTRLKWAQLNNGDFDYGGSINYSEDDLFSLLTALWGTLTTPEEVLVSNVAGEEIADIIGHWIIENFHCRTEFITTPAEDYGLINAYPIPEQLGVDRWLSMLTTWDDYQSGFCLVDAGTAITFDAVDHKGKHLGGLITPGIDMMQEVLREQLPGCRQNKPQTNTQSHILADNTYNAITGGCLYTAVAFINHLTEDLTDVLGADVPCVITGGYAQKIAPLLANEYEYRSHLVLHGLALYSADGKV